MLQLPECAEPERQLGARACGRLGSVAVGYVGRRRGGREAGRAQESLTGGRRLERGSGDRITRRGAALGRHLERGGVNGRPCLRHRLLHRLDHRDTHL